MSSGQLGMGLVVALAVVLAIAVAIVFAFRRGSKDDWAEPLPPHEPRSYGAGAPSYPAAPAPHAMPSASEADAHPGSAESQTGPEDLELGDAADDEPQPGGEGEDTSETGDGGSAQEQPGRRSIDSSEQFREQHRRTDRET